MAGEMYPRMSVQILQYRGWVSSFAVMDLNTMLEYLPYLLEFILDLEKSLVTSYASIVIILETYIGKSI